MDYLDIDETVPFDKIASVGTFEHVGQKQFPSYFAKIHRLLKPGGSVLNHGITSDSLDGSELGSGTDEFVERYVFPQGELAHLSQVTGAMSHQNLECLDVESLRPHYAKTLWHWVDRLEAAAEHARSIVTEQQFRIWQIYMGDSAHAFERGWLSMLPDSWCQTTYRRHGPSSSNLRARVRALSNRCRKALEHYTRQTRYRFACPDKCLIGHYCRRIRQFS